ncbi:vacuolar CorA family magnesium ion transmembrane transporter Mnr2 [Schizosaccharomyces osmophilus]|uniref:Vacuolar CorA family magnesium ion transmembrane transporter Mnr2 n=1 Tax=Schizosaccharomyces osmophilus TaxID=2545709 RepID=A0AAE9WDX5_9SCHI|nr:vacuolar CorA family magnesium ion transmembrane transporter Mnr2 [Schizosaccharomyces osmophilus]WBW74430.1 vacuolar CorA family magnesium ion transmembrane transporter Mnr2 [Schizosaccharomyces osmophilus]
MPTDDTVSKFTMPGPSSSSKRPSKRPPMNISNSSARVMDINTDRKPHIPHEAKVENDQASQSVPNDLDPAFDALRFLSMPRNLHGRMSNRSRPYFPLDPSLKNVQNTDDEPTEETRLLDDSNGNAYQYNDKKLAKDVNNPPSMPSSLCSSPKFQANKLNESDEDFSEDIPMPESHPESISRQSEEKPRKDSHDGDVSDFGISSQPSFGKSPKSPSNHYEQYANNQVNEEAQEVVEGRDELFLPISTHHLHDPDFSIMDEWAAKMKETVDEFTDEESDHRKERNRKMSEPLLVNGRYRIRDRWAQLRKSEVDRPYRFTFFTEELPSTIHSHEMWELAHDNQTFENLFRSGGTWWLDVSSPKEEEIRILAKTFGIHPLTVEDITMAEDREKVELFRSYYFVTFRSFNQLPSGPEYLKPLNFYLVVFRDGILTFHMNPTPHPANVRRRIRQLNGYLTINADWIAYALLDDTTDAFAPFIEKIEDEVDTIDEIILGIHHEHVLEVKPQESMLKRVGECRKLIMSLLRLLANKADVVRGLSKRCNESWQVAPRGEIALYLGDVQDHIVTMVQNLNHYEKILSRSHSNYLAQISINMTLVSNETNEVLSRLTILGTILIPLNLVTGLWGMNVQVPGQDVPGLQWFFGILGSLILFAVFSVLLCKWYQVI